MEAPSLEIRDRYNAWIKGGSYTDEQVSDFSGLPVRSLRELHQLGALTPLSSRPGRGNKRLWDRAAIVRAALTSTVMLGGYSLPVAARIAQAWANSHNTKDAFSYASDWQAIFDTAGKKWAASRENGRKVLATWLSEEYSGGAIDPECDAYLDIVDGEHLIARIIDYDSDIIAEMKLCDIDEEKRKILRIGRLVENGSSIVVSDYIFADKPLTPGQVAVFDQVIDGESVLDILKRFGVENLGFLDGGGRYVDPEFLKLKDEEKKDETIDYKSESISDRQYRITEERNIEKEYTRSIINTARTTLSINMTLSQRFAMRKALGLE